MASVAEPTAPPPPAAPAAGSQHFIRQIIAADVQNGVNGGQVHTRFPPEPNGYLHIGHAKAICIDFGLAQEFGGRCNLRMDDTNPSKEETEYVESILEDVRWLGFHWDGEVRYASNYFQAMSDYAEELVKLGKAYVCDLSQEEVRASRGTATEPAKPSPYRERSVAENLELFRRMRAGEFPDGARTLRAKIDLASPNFHLRDPVLYRIMRATHHRTGDTWCLYPMYDYAHPIEDALEGITHSLCTLEFEIHRPLYDWVLDQKPGFFPSRPRQYEFARLNLSYTVMSKRKLLELVRQGLVTGWDDPRLPTLGGLRRRGYTPEAIRRFCEAVGVTKYDSLTDVALLESCLRDDLNRRARRHMAVLDPLKVVISNWPEGQVEELTAVNNPEDPAAGTRRLPFGRELYIERADFMEEPPKKFFRLAPGREVRLRWGYFIRCTEVVKDAAGQVVELRCTYDPATRGGNAPDGRKVQGTIHWVSAAHAVDAEIRLYDRLFTVEQPGTTEGVEFTAELNPESLKVVTGKVEPALAAARPGVPLQFERVGYFCADQDGRPGQPVFNRTVTLKDSWAKVAGKG
ncbi:MAG: glutamine--tRNA ligase/YqeY domain fusion protein [Lentisphaeria bacterium]|jgi:glutaminyl-tRNA synthetase